MLLLWFLVSAIVGASPSTQQLDKAFSKCDFQIGTHTITAYVADTEIKRERGLMHVEHLPANMGMIFVFDNSRPLSFWMKNTRIPLAIGFFDEDLKFFEAKEMEVPNPILEINPPSYHSRKAALYALEMNKGWFTKAKVLEGMRLSVRGRCPSVRFTRQ